MILKSVDKWNQACQNSETVQLLGYDWQVWSAPIRSHIANHLIQIGISELGSQIFLFRAELLSGFVCFFFFISEVCSGFAHHFANWLIYNPHSEVLLWNYGLGIIIQIIIQKRGSRIIWFRSELRSGLNVLRSTLRSPDMKLYGSWIIQKPLRQYNYKNKTNKNIIYKYKALKKINNGFIIGFFVSTVLLQIRFEIGYHGLIILTILHTHTHTHTHTHSHTHTHTHVGFYGLRGLSIGVMVFILYKLYVLLPYT